MSKWLVMKTADGRERPFPISKERMIIGRETRCDVRIAVSSVSDRHCEIRVEAEELHLTDLDSLGGTLHNGRPVQRARLADEDTLTVGPVTFVVRIKPGTGETEIRRQDESPPEVFPGA